MPDSALARVRTTDFAHIIASADHDRWQIWQYLLHNDRPCFTHAVLDELNIVADQTRAACSDRYNPFRFFVTASAHPDVFSLGGDLNLFLGLIELRDRDELWRYARRCAEGQYRIYRRFGTDLVTVALVQGDALGGGFEMCLAHDVIIAERQAKFGLPECLFNMFPGMGAYSFLSRRVGTVQAERMILSGKTYGAWELYEMGIVDRIAEQGEGVAAANAFMDEFDRNRHARRSVLAARRIVSPVTREELMAIAAVWVDNAMALGSADLRRMRHLANAQERKGRDQ